MSNNYRPSDPYQQNMQPRASQMYSMGQGGSGNFNAPRGAGGSNPQNFQNSGASNNYFPNQSMSMSQNRPGMSQPLQQARPQMAMQQMSGTQGQQPMYQNRQNLNQVQPQQQQQYSNAQQFQQGPRGQQFPQNSQTYSNSSQGLQSNSGEWEQFFSQSTPGNMGHTATAGFPRGVTGGNNNPSMGFNRPSPTAQGNYGNSMETGFQGGISQQQQQPQQMMSASDGMHGARGPRGVVGGGPGRGGVPAGRGFDANMTGGRGGYAGRGMPMQDMNTMHGGGGMNEYDPTYSINASPNNKSSNSYLSGGFQEQQQAYQPAQNNWQQQSKLDTYGGAMSNHPQQVVNSNLSSTNPSSFLRNVDNNNHQSFVTSNNQMMSQDGYGNPQQQQRNPMSSGKWSTQFENPLAYDPAVQGMAVKPTMNTLNNNNSNSYLMNSNPSATMNYLTTPSTNNANTVASQQQQPPGAMSTSMKIMQAVLPRHAVRPSTTTATPAPASSFDSHPRPLRGGGGGRGGSFPRGDSAFIGRKRDRSRSKSPLLRSRSPSSSTADRFAGGRGRGRGGGRGSAYARDSSPISTRPSKKPYASRSPPAGPRGAVTRSGTPPPPSHNPSTTTTTSTTTASKYDASNLSARELVEEIHLPAVSKQSHSLTILELLAKFPKLYIPADFTDLKIEWSQLSEAIVYDYFFNIAMSIPMVFENTPSTLTSSTNGIANGKDTEDTKGEAVATTTASTTSHCYSDILEPSKFSFVTSHTVNNLIVDPHHQLPLYPDRFVTDVKPVKFNAKVLVCCGLKDPETERIDHNYCRKLRMLCGRRKGSILLLGSCWNEDLDGGDPLTDRSCLFHTARRALLAQSLLDIGRGEPFHNLVKLGEITYHRPKEEIKGKTYPEQEEVTALYLFSLQKNLLDAITPEDFEEDWAMFNARMRGEHVGPMMGRTIEESFRAWSEYHTASTASSSAVTTTIKEETTATPASAGSGVTVEGTTTDEPEKVSETTTNNNNTTPSHKEGGSEATKADPKLIVKPEVPSVLVCPMPLPPDIDPAKKQDALSLRVMPLSTILSYTPDDCSEKIFEASIAAEILKSCLAMNFANVIVDFVLAMTGHVTTLADQRIVAAVKRLKELNLATRAKAANATGAVPATSPAKAKPAVESENPTPANTTATTATTAPSDGKETAETTDKKNDAMVTEEIKEQESVEALDTPNESKDLPFTIESVNENHLLLDVSETEATDHHPQESEEAATIVLSDEEARVWRRRFVAACRWYDMKQDRFLRPEQLQLIFFASQRNVSRADAMSSIEDVCEEGGEKLKYETCI